jgi:hypothetical protein
VIERLNNTNPKNTRTIFRSRLCVSLSVPDLSVNLRSAKILEMASRKLSPHPHLLTECCENKYAYYRHINLRWKSCRVFFELLFHEIYAVEFHCSLKPNIDEEKIIKNLNEGIQPYIQTCFEVKMLLNE